MIPRAVVVLALVVGTVALGAQSNPVRRSRLSTIEEVAPPNQPPDCSITSPTELATFTTTVAAVTIGGSCADTDGTIATVTANCVGPGGTSTPTVTGTTAWSFPITLVEGATTCTITGTDNGGAIGNDAVVATYEPDIPDPPPGAPALRTGRPRVHFIEATDTGLGRQLDEWRTDLCAVPSLTAAYQTHISLLDTKPTSPTGKARGPAAHHGYSFAMAALTDPALAPCITFGKTKTQYQDAAAAHAEYIAAQMYPTLIWKESNDLEQLTEHNSPTMAITMIHDWLAASGYPWTNTQEQTLANGCINIFKGRADSVPFGSQHQKPFTGSCALTFFGDEPTGTYPGTGEAYTTIFAAMYARYWDDWLDPDGIVGTTNSISTGLETHIALAMGTSSGGEAPWHPEGSSYQMSYAIHAILFGLQSATATNFDVFTRNDYLGQWGHFIHQMLRPQGLDAAAEHNGLAVKYGVSGSRVGFGEGFHRTAIHLAWAAALTKTVPDTTLARVLRWIVTEYPGLDHDVASETELSTWPFTRFLYGAEHLTPLSPVDAGYAQSYELGNGWLVFNGCYTASTCTKFIHHAPFQTAIFSGHWKPYTGMGLSLMHRGSLFIFGGQSKGDGAGAVGWQTYSTLDTGVMSIYDSTEPSNDNTQIENGRFGGYSFSPPASPAPTGLCKQVIGRYLCNIGERFAQALNAASNTYDYAWTRYTGLFRESKVDYADREIEYLRGVQNDEYGFVIDRVTTDNAASVKRFTLKFPHTATSSAALTTIEQYSDFNNVQGGIWTTPGTATLRTENTKTVDGIVNDGFALVKGLEVDSIWEILGGDFAEFLDVTTARNHYAGSLPEITAVSTGVPAAIITTNEKHRITEGTNKIRIKGQAGSTPDLNGVHTATIIDDFHFSIPVNVSVAGTGGHVIKSIINDTGADGVGRYRVERKPQTPATFNMFITCMRWGQASAIATTNLNECTLLDNEANERMRGAQLTKAVSGEKYVLLWKVSTGTTPPTFPIVYTPTLTGLQTHRLHNVAASTTYHCDGNPAPGTTEIRTAAFGDSVPCVSSEARVLEFTYTR